MSKADLLPRLFDGLVISFQHIIRWIDHVYIYVYTYIYVHIYLHTLSLYIYIYIHIIGTPFCWLSPPISLVKSPTSSGFKTHNMFTEAPQHRCYSCTRCDCWNRSPTFRPRNSRWPAGLDGSDAEVTYSMCMLYDICRYDMYMCIYVKL